mmetsp:Transcript_87677/g.209538  ORF Transcript_87677/g.209538 Transcript_87677/m.209538 type:complete len:121 (-) Transcript_87677:205-567(-)
MEKCDQRARSMERESERQPMKQGDLGEKKEQRQRQACSRSRSAARQGESGGAGDQQVRSQSQNPTGRRRHRQHRRRYVRQVSRCPSPHRCRPEDYALRRSGIAAAVAEVPTELREGEGQG